MAKLKDDSNIVVVQAQTSVFRGITNSPMYITIECPHCKKPINEEIHSNETDTPMPE